MFDPCYFYVKTYVPAFGKPIRLYLDDNEGSFSYISANLIDKINPSAIQIDENGEYARLDLIFMTREGEECEMDVCFNVIETDGNEFVLGDDVLQDYDYDIKGIYFYEGKVKVYIRG